MRDQEGRWSTAEESVARRLRDEAERHEPDRDRMWSRVETAMVGPYTTGPPEETERWSRPRRGWWSRWSGLRVAATALGTAAVVGVTSFTALALTDRGGRLPHPPMTGRDGGDIPAQSPAQTSSQVPTPGKMPEGAASATPEGTRSTSPGTTKRPAAKGRIVEVTGAPGANSTDHWGENTLRLEVRRPLAGLDVTIRVVRTRRVNPTGSWLSLPASDFRISTDATDRAVVYRWTLFPGRAIRPGSYVIAAQYDRGADHDPRRDAFTLTATAATTETTVQGHF
ncbi:hypothetical protein SAMN04489712_1043 [Thermomonospora echinospora]|uniref:Uncharacterized protein n=1 Tax=Thermomonospora echinospora TaxID=1992 RepID=A0A1H5YGJ3_9ACTN|nr:hypothetical protein [Thermomonospora echinospora]SEG23203.1 hypothetical protein SAMN04489712_1043 [Thermomonospora echinospora]